MESARSRAAGVSRQRRPTVRVLHAGDGAADQVAARPRSAPPVREETDHRLGANIRRCSGYQVFRRALGGETSGP